eukprot:5046414-Alexandrium_andersonii.AAC.1
MGREDLGRGPETGEKVHRPTIAVPSELVPRAPAGNDASAYYLQQALRIFQDYTVCLLALSSPDIRAVRLQKPQLP